MNKKIKSLIIHIVIIAVLYGLLTVLIGQGLLSRSMQKLLVPIGINIILAVSLNLTVGFLGELSLGHAGFMSCGAYAGCLVAMHLGLPEMVAFPVAILAGGLVAALFGVIIGIPALRLRGDYLAIVTLAFGEIIRSLFNSLTITGGAKGLQGIPRLTNFNIIFVAAVVTIILISNLVKSKHGRAICSIRDNVIAAESAGINVTYYKLMTFVVSAFFAGVAGVLYGYNLGQLVPKTFDFNKSIEILVMVVMGGMGSIPGSIIAATIITLLPELLRELDKYRLLIYAVVLVVMMILNSSPWFIEFKSNLKNKMRLTKKVQK